MNGHPYLDKDHRKIRRLFDGIAPRYDFLNHLLSFNLDRSWRKHAIAELQPRSGGVYLDACSGTGDLAFTLLKWPKLLDQRVVGTDFSLEMLKHGAHKARSKSASAGVNGRAPHAPVFIAADTLRLPFADGTFHGATVGFGIRNVENLEAGLAELRRVLRRSHRLVLLEFTPLANRLLRPFADFYSRVLLPRIGNVISGSDDNAYGYLNDSIGRWPDGESLAGVMKDVGFKGVGWRALFPGNVALHWGHR